MKLIVNLQISVDGVVQANGGNNQEIDPGMTRGGWASPLFDDESMAFLNAFYQRAEAFLFGRRTYDLFAKYWGSQDSASSPIANALNTKPKYVVSNSLTNPQWADSTVLSGDIIAALTELKAKSAGGELQVHGSVALTQWLLTNKLVDELYLLVCPVVVGRGKRLFPENGPDMAFELIQSQSFPKGIVLQVYRPAGQPEYA